jgi:hypothetical protein
LPESLIRLVLWLFVLDLGIAFGAGLYETRIVVPRWLGSAPGGGPRWDAAAARQDDVGLRFWVYVTTVPLTVLTLASLAAAASMPGAVRTWWLIAVGAALLDRVLTFAYFIPTMITLMREGSLDEAQALARARQWVSLGYLRHAATLIAWLAALKALTLMPR